MNLCESLRGRFMLPARFSSRASVGIVFHAY